MIKINNIEKTEQEWLNEFNIIGRTKFFILYKILNKRLLLEEIINQTADLNQQPPTEINPI